MSDTQFKSGSAANAKKPARSFLLRSAVPLLAVAACALVAGCAQTDSVTVGSVPDDYRTNHPIVIGQKDVKIDLPIDASQHGMTRSQRETLLGFLDRYDRSAAPVLTILTPSGSVNEVAARAAARDFARVASSNGVRSSRVSMVSYQASADEVSAPVRLTYSAIRAQTDRCGRWPDDLSDTTENKHYANFGCAYQNNLAAQVVNPGDLIGPRKQSDIDAENRGRVIGDYRSKGGQFSGGSEIDY